MLMTGKYGHRNYERFSHLPPEERTFGHLFQDHGYRTAFGGKWQLGDMTRIGEAGFDAFATAAGVRARGNPQIVFHDGRDPGDISDRFGEDVIVDFLVDFIREDDDQPFFVYFPAFMPHAPYLPTPGTPGWRNGSRGKADPVYFASMVRHLDGQLGRLLAAVEAEGELDNTVILFTGDNGSGGGVVSQLDGQTVRGAKGSFTDLGTRVPMFARWPNRSPAGVRVAEPVDFTDFYATFADMLGVLEEERATHAIDGQSFWPILSGDERRGPREHAFIFFKGKVQYGSHMSAGGYFARGERWKLYHDGRLFDLDADPFEKQPILPGTGDAEAATRRAELKAVFEELEVDPTMLIPLDDRDEWLHEIVRQQRRAKTWTPAKNRALHAFRQKRLRLAVEEQDWAELWIALDVEPVE
jgi:arylsulfatase A